MLLDLVFSFDSVITAVGIADHVEVMIAAVIIAILVMMAAAEPIAAFVHKHASTKMLALAFLVMVGMALIADGRMCTSSAVSSTPRWPSPARSRR